MSHLCDDAYIGGILHDMGKIIVFHVHPGLLEMISSHCNDKGIEETILEKLAMGVSHSRIGYEIAMKWNFPEYIAGIIRYHHTPLIAPEEIKDIVCIIYLSNILTKVSHGEFYYSAIEPAVLEKFNIKSEMELLNLENKLFSLYELQKLKIQND